MTILITIAMGLSIAFVGSLVWALCRAAAKPTPKPSKCDEAWADGHEFGFNRALELLAEGRPTMPSESEPESETERRTR